MYGKIVVVGSTNTDFVFTAAKFPAAGETVLGSGFNTTYGGKGANQAMAARLLGANVVFISAVGDDKIGIDTKQYFNSMGIAADYIFVKDNCASGTACILVEENSGENMIVVAPGANAKLSPDDMVKAAPAFAEAGMVVLQAEIPIETITWVIEYAARLNIPVLLNPAPMPENGFSEQLLKHVNILTPNETEILALFPENNDIDEAARRLLDIGVETIIVTRGHLGSLCYTSGGRLTIPAHEVTAIDTVGAGDTFSAAVAAAIVEGKDLKSALEFASIAAALSTTRRGAQAAMPKREEVNAQMLITNL